MASGLTAQRLREVLNYNPDTGVFTWRCDMHCGKGRAIVKAGATAGGIRNTGYIAIAVDGKRYLAHRLAWLHVHGYWPEGNIDHVNGVRDDNRFNNLREATQRQNCGNSRLPRNNTSGFKGVSFKKDRGVYEAYISINRRKKRLGQFTCPEAAHRAYCAAAIDYFGEFARFK